MGGKSGTLLGHFYLSLFFWAQKHFKGIFWSDIFRIWVKNIISIQSSSKYLELHIKEDRVNLQVKISDFIYTMLGRKSDIVMPTSIKQRNKTLKDEDIIRKYRIKIYIWRLCSLACTNVLSRSQSHIHYLSYKWQKVSYWYYILFYTLFTYFD